MIIRRLGLVLERKEDALRVGRPLEELYHWREPDEVDAIVEAFQTLGYEVRLLGTPVDLLNGLESVRDSVDFIVNLSVGFVSRSRLAEAPTLFRLAGLPHWGADAYSKMVSQHKPLSKSFMNHLGLPTPAWAYLHPGEDSGAAEVLGFPLIVKPASEGSSIGVGPEARVDDPEALSIRVAQIHQNLGMPAIVERFISGRELKVGMVGHETLRFTGIIEDTLADGSPIGEAFLYFGAKKAGSFGKTPREAAAPEFQRLLEDCRKLYHTFLPLDYATFDVRMDAAGDHYFLEFNADATLHPARTLAQCADLHGLSYTQLLGTILETSMQRQGLRGVHMT